MSVIKKSTDLYNNINLQTDHYLTRDVAFLNMGERWDELKKVTDYLSKHYNIDYIANVMGNKNVFLQSFGNENWQDFFIKEDFWGRGVNASSQTLVNLRPGEKKVEFWHVKKHLVIAQKRAEVFGEFKTGLDLFSCDKEGNALLVSVTFKDVNISDFDKKTLRKMLKDLLETGKLLVPYFKSFNETRELKEVEKHKKEIGHTIFT